MKSNNTIVLTLDAGGTNFVFSAISENSEVVQPVSLPSNGTNLKLCLQIIKEGFKAVIKQLEKYPDAISFAFPGPADFPNGIIGDLYNLPAFRGGIPLGGILENEFKIPVFINNDGDLFAYGEALTGYLPYLNNQMEKSGSPKRFRNLAGFTLGTGFGAGIVINGELMIGDNSAGAEVCLMRNKKYPVSNAEEGVSIRAIKRVYAQLSGIDFEKSPEPFEIYKIGIGEARGNREAACESFRQMGEVLGDIVAQAVALTDSIAIIGGGIAGAFKLFMPFLLEEMKTHYTTYSGNTFPRLVQQVFNLDDSNDLQKFIKGDTKILKVEGSEKTYFYDAMKRIGVGISKIGTNKATALGAYNFALKKLQG